MLRIVKNLFFLLYRGLMRVKLNLVILGIAAISSVGAQIVWIGPALLTKETNLHDRLEDRALIAVIAAIDDVNFEDVALTQRIGRRLISLGDILGGSIYDSEGTLIGQFGKTPSLSWFSARNEGTIRQRDPSLCCIDVLFTRKQTALAYDLILRLDAKHANGEIQNHFAELALTSFVNALICCISMIVLSYFLVSRPIARIRSAAAKAAADPQNATRYGLNSRRKDELGALSKAVLTLAEKTASVYQNELYVAKQVMYRTRLAIIHFNPQGRVIAVNRSALRLFQVKTLKELREANQKVFRFEKKLEGDAVDAIESLGDGNYSEAGFVITKKSEIPCMISGAIMRKANGEVMRYAITIVPALDYANQIKTLKAEIAEREAETAARKRQWAEMRLVSETYNGILEKKTGTRARPSEIAVFNIKSAVDSWRDYVSDLGLSIDIEWQDREFSIKADQQTLFETFKDIMSCLFLRSQFENPVFSIHCEKTGENAVDLTISDTSLRDCRSYLPEDEERSHWRHLLPLILANLSVLKGKLLNANVRQGAPNEITIRLPLDVSRKATGSRRQAAGSAAA